MCHWIRQLSRSLDLDVQSHPLQVGGSNLAKQQEQLGTGATDVTSLFDFCFPENGLMAFRLGKPLASTSFIEWIGEEKYQKLVNFILRYFADLQLPKKRGTFIEFRNGMINVSPIGRNASVEERNEFEAYVYELGLSQPLQRRQLICGYHQLTIRQI